MLITSKLSEALITYLDQIRSLRHQLILHYPHVQLFGTLSTTLSTTLDDQVILPQHLRQPLLHRRSNLFVANIPCRRLEKSERYFSKTSLVSWRREEMESGSEGTGTILTTPVMIINDHHLTDLAI